MSRTKVSNEAAAAFIAGRKFSKGNTKVFYSTSYGWVLSLFGNAIAIKSENDNTFQITDAGWNTVTTKDRLNALPGVKIVQKGRIWYLNGIQWDGQLISLN